MSNDVNRHFGTTDLEPLLVRPRAAWRMLGCGNTRGYALLNAGELESFLDGRARKITVASIHAYIARNVKGTETPDSAIDVVPGRRGPRRHRVSSGRERSTAGGPSTGESNGR